jgi:DNA-binding transcriptional regulator YiaG
MNSSLKERFARLGPTRGIDRVNGSPAVLSLRPSPNRKSVKTVLVALALASRGMTMLRAERAVEEMMERGRIVVLVPNLDSEAGLAKELADAGCVAATVAAHEVDVRTLRERLGLTQEQFALRYGLDLDAVRNWEHKRRTPDLAAQSYLRVIARMPEQASEAQEEAIAGPPAS